MNILNELIKTLQLWDTHAVDTVCNTSNIPNLCCGISCSLCPMNVGNLAKENAWNTLREHYERVN